MRGYLQRLALGVMQPVGAIHPVVGSVFSPHQHASPGETLPLEEVVLSGSRPISHSQNETEETSFTGRQKPGVPFKPELSRLRDPDPVFVPLMSKSETVSTRSPADRVVNGQAEDPVQPAEERTSVSHPGQGAGAERVQEPGPAQELALKHVYTPIMMMSANTGHLSSQEMPGPKANPFPAPGRATRQVDSSRRSGSASHEPDEIQIHIGRIEVTAVQQTSVPAVVKPARKGLSLDEYLKRSNGRVR